MRKALQVHQCALQTALAQVRPGAGEVRDEIELQKEPFGSRSNQLRIHGGYLEGPAVDSSSADRPNPPEQNARPCRFVPAPLETRRFHGMTRQRAGEPRCTCSVMRMAVSRARIPASPPTMGGLPVRMQSRKDSISALSASP